MTKKITWMFVVLFGISSVIITCKRDETSDNINSIPIQADFIGPWTVNSEPCGDYTMAVTAAGNTLTLTNFHSSFTITATSSGTSMTIPLQSAASPSDVGPYTFQGTGSLSTPSKMSFSYTRKDTSGATMNCNATAVK